VKSSGGGRTVKAAAGQAPHTYNIDNKNKLIKFYRWQIIFFLNFLLCRIRKTSCILHQEARLGPIIFAAQYEEKHTRLLLGSK